MTVNNENYREYYQGDDSTTIFPVTFYFLEDEHLEVILTDTVTNVATTQVLNTDYTVQGAGDESGGSVTMVVAPTSDETLTIRRDVPLTQELDYIENDNFPAESHETALDKLTMICQEQADVQENTFTVQPGYGDVDVEIAPQADSFLAWDDDADELINVAFGDVEDIIQVEKLHYNTAVVLQTVSSSKIQLTLGSAIEEFSTDGTLAGNSDAALPTEKAVKTYVDGLTTAQDLDFQGDSGGAQSVILDSQVLDFVGGTGIDTVSGAQALAISIDGTVVTLDDPQTLTNKTLTDPIINQILANSVDVGITLNSNGSVELHYDGVSVLNTTVDGIQLNAGTSVNEFSIDGTLAGNSDDALPTEKAVKTYVDTNLGPAGNILSFIGDNGGQQQVILATEVQTLAGGNNIETTGSALTMTFALVDEPIINGILTKTGEYGIRMYADGSTDLFYDNVRKLSTTAEGIQIMDDGTTDGITIEMDSADNVIMRGVSNSAIMVLGSKSSGGVNRSIIQGDPDGRLDFYHTGTKTAATYWNASANRAGLQVYGEAGSKFGILSMDDDDDVLRLSNEVLGGHVRLYGTQSGGSDVLLFNGDPDAAASIYHNNVVALETLSNGIRINDASDEEVDLFFSNSDFFIHNKNNPGRILISGGKAAGGDATLALMDPDGYVALYFDGAAVMYTQSEGIEIATGKAGIKFPGANVVSTNPYTLDDYREGSWTPKLADATTGGNESVTSGSGRYTKIGNMVFCTGYITNVDLTNLTGTNGAFIVNFPFNTSATFQWYGPLVLSYSEMTEELYTIRKEAGNKAAMIRISRSNSSSLQLLVNQMTSLSTDIQFSVAYRTDE